VVTVAVAASLAPVTVAVAVLSPIAQHPAIADDKVLVLVTADVLANG